MRLLLDTHVVLWWASSDRRLMRTARSLIAAPENEKAVSAATLWEIAVKKALGRIDVNIVELRDAIAADGFEELSIRFDHAVALETLPPLHGDPFDRMLIAQAIADGWQLMTHDDAILGYSDVPGLAVIRA